MTEQTADTPRKWTIKRVLIIVVIVYAAIILVPLIIGVFAARADAERAAAVMAYARDLLLVILFLLSGAVMLALAVLIIQIAALAGVIKVQTSSVLGEVRGAFRAVRGAATFIAEAVAQPAIRVLSFVAGVFSFLREFALLRRAVRREPRANPPESG